MKIKRIFESYLKRYKWNVAKKVFKSIIVDCKDFKLKVSLQDTVIAENFYFYGKYGFDELDASFEYLLEKKILNKNCFLDIGANIGFMSLYAISKLGFESAICIEPDEINHAILNDNFRLNNLTDKALSFKYGLSSETVKAKLIRSNNNYGDHRVFTENELLEADKYNGEVQRGVIDIELITLDELSASNKQFDKVSFICIDVQGFELEVLKGAKSFLTKGIPMLIELDPYLLEKKNASKESLFSEVKKYYSSFVDVRDGNREYRIDEFLLFYDNLKNASQQHKDILLIPS